MNAVRIERIFDVLTYLGSHPEGRSLSQVAADLDLPVSSSHDLLRSLTEAGGAVLAGDKRYSLGFRAVSLALSIVDAIDVRSVARPHLERLRDTLDETVYLAVREGDQVVYADRLPGGQRVSFSIGLGQVRALHGSSVGKLMAANDAALEAAVLAGPELEAFTPATIVDPRRLRREFAAIRDRGYSISLGEGIAGVVGLAAPIVDPNGAVRAAAMVAVPEARLPNERIADFVAAMRECTQAVSRQLGGADREAATG
ncbi:MAG: IclR family transcriptional regulator [Acidimicrobiia bacterium]